jgi:type VI secretion system secreted protein VgrG
MCMIQYQPITLTLLTGERPRKLPVVAFNGQEAINAPYRFAVDLLIPDPQPDLDLLRRSSAYLTLDPLHYLHGRITRAHRMHAGTRASLYRISLGPHLLDLEQAPRRRLFQQLSVVQIIEQLLREHAMPTHAYRFEPLVGIYPQRPLCVQQDETDLHLLQRLCEEEGIHFHFEHGTDMHTLVFADDPACFPSRYLPVQFCPPASGAAQGPILEHLAERWAMPSTSVRHQTMPRTPYRIALAHGAASSKEPGNQHYDPCDRSRLPSEREAHDRQTSARTLEQQRCERRTIVGRGSELPLTSGQIIQVQEHPDSRFNDQWLLVEVDHFCRQPQVLLGNDPHDAVAILEALEDREGQNDASQCQASWRNACTIAAFKRGYRNRVRLLPWEMPFRPSLEHAKPVAQGYQSATLLDATLEPWHARDQCRLPVSLDTLPGQDGQLTAPAYLAPRQISRMDNGARVILGQFDNDPDRPIICAIQPSQDATGADLAQSPTDMGSLLAQSISEPQHESPDDPMCLRADETLSLSMGAATVEVGPGHIRLTTRQAETSAPASAAQLRSESSAEDAPEPG